MPIFGMETEIPLFARRARSFGSLLLATVFALLVPGVAFATSGGDVDDRIFANGFEKPLLPGDVELSPTKGAVLPAVVLPEIGLRLTTGTLNPANWRLFVDDEDVTSQAQASASSIVYTPDEPLFEGDHAVQVRHGLRVWSWGFRTSTPPEIVDVIPGIHYPGTARPLLGARFTDVGSGVDMSRVVLKVNGEDVTADATITDDSIRYQPQEDLPDGTNAIRYEIADFAGNVRRRGAALLVGPEPEVEFISPSYGEILPYGSEPEIVIGFRVSHGEINRDDFWLNFEGEPVTEQSTVTMMSPSEGVIVYRPDRPLAPAHYGVEFFVRTTAGHEGNGPSVYTTLIFTIDIKRNYELRVLSPASGGVVAEDYVDVFVDAESTAGRAERILVAGEPADWGWLEDPDDPTTSSQELFRRVQLKPGLNVIPVRAEYREGEVREISIEVHSLRLADVKITSPVDWSTLGPIDAGAAVAPGSARDLTGRVQRPVTIEGTVSQPVIEVQINQQQAQLAPDGLSFLFPNYFLHEGTNLISAVAKDVHGRLSNAQVTVYVDQTAPLLAVETPTPDTVTSLQRVDVRGIVNDAVEGRIGVTAPQVDVFNTANGYRVAAQVAHLGFLARDVPLEVGLNILTVTATDLLGNSRSSEVAVVRTLAGTSRLSVVSAPEPIGSPGQRLAEPLVIQASDAEGEPLRGLPVRFDVMRGSGSVDDGVGRTASDGLNPARNLELLTDSDGLIRVWMTLGQDARAGSDVLRASAQEIAEVVTFTASVMSGEARKIAIYGASGMQYVGVHGMPIEALMAQVLDAFDNPVPDAQVEFRIVEGDGRFEADSSPHGQVSADGQTLRTQADRNGIVAARPRAGAQPGLLEISAEVLLTDGVRATGAYFQLEVLPRRDGPTSLSGLVFDHTGVPLPGVRLSIDRTALSVLSDEEGRFYFPAHVPAGKVDLFVDGREVRFQRGSAEFEYPALHFEAAAVQGQSNQLPHAIYLPPVEVSRAIIVGGKEDVVLTLPEFEGFQMRVRAHSVTFPDGSRVGPLVVSAVHADRLPMVPLGVAGRFVAVGWTLQPTNTRFDPPIEVRIPNTAGLLPGQTIPIAQWDHDLATFVPMGLGTVSEDGTQIVSDPGSGITKAGWGGGPPPPPPNTGENQCPPEGRDVEQASLRIAANGHEDELFLPWPGRRTSIAFNATVSGECQSPRINWNLGSMGSSSRMSFSKNYTGPTDDQITADLTCKCGNSASARLRLSLVEVKFAETGQCTGFDDSVTPHWLMVPQGGVGQNQALAHIRPASAVDLIEFESVNPAMATVTPTVPTSSPQTIAVVAGGTRGEAAVEAKGPNGEVVATLEVDVRRRLDRTIMVFMVSEENDDDQRVARGNGEPNQECIRAGASGVLNSTPSGDDVVSPDGRSILSGPNGICDSNRVSGDEELIRKGRGLPESICVAPGSNDFRDTRRAASGNAINTDDLSIHSGNNGICRTEANQRDLPPVRSTTAAALQHHLNEVTWGRQANIFSEVIGVSPGLVNFDLDRNEKLADPKLFSATLAEMNEISAELGVLSSAHAVVYFVNAMEVPSALALRARPEAFGDFTGGGSVEYKVAHELGHIFGRKGESSAQLDLMFQSTLSSSPCRITKVDRDAVNPN